MEKLLKTQNIVCEHEKLLLPRRHEVEIFSLFIFQNDSFIISVSIQMIFIACKSSFRSLKLFVGEMFSSADER